MRRRGAGEPRGALEFVVGPLRRRRGPRRPSDATGRTTSSRQSVELLAERVAGGLGVADQQRGEPDVAASSIHRYGLSSSRDERNRALQTIVASRSLAASAAPRRRRIANSVRRVVGVADLLQPRGGSVDPFAKLIGAARPPVLAPARHRESTHRPGFRARQRLVGDRRGDVAAHRAQLSLRRAPGARRRESQRVRQRPGDRLGLRMTAPVFGSSPERPQRPAPCAQCANAQRGVRAVPGMLQRPVDPATASA